MTIAQSIGYPVILRPNFTLGGTGGGFADDEESFQHMMKNALELSPVHEVLIEKSVKGWKEIEYEVIRDKNDTAITVCNMENLDPVGVHTGDSIVVCPSQTLTNKEYQMLRDSALKIIRALKIEGGCNVQFALSPNSMQYYLIEVNPRVSRSSALASKASGYPIARVSAKIGIGMTLDEIQIANTPAAFEPSLDYVVTKIPRFPFDKFTEADNSLSTQMKATGEIMSIGRSFEESLLKGIRSLETGAYHLYIEKFDGMSKENLLEYIRTGRDDRVFAIAELLRRNCDFDIISQESSIDKFFITAMKNIIEMENFLKASPNDTRLLRSAKRPGFSDKEIAHVWGRTEREIFSLRVKHDIMPVYKMIDTCASEFESYIPYFYSTYEDENESIVSDKRKIIVLGSGPIRIGQGIEFDYSAVHAVQTLKAAGCEAIIINNNPETVSTDYTCSDKLYFEPLCTEDIMNIIIHEKPEGVIVTLGGRAMQIVAKDEAMREYLATAGAIDEDKPVLIDHYIMGKEVEVDAVCDGQNVFVPGIMELVERTGVHSGDSISVYQPYSLSQKVKNAILDYTEKLGLGIGIKGLFNIQFIVDKAENVYIIEVNPRSSRTVPFLSKATGWNLADIGTLVMLGKSLREQSCAEWTLIFRRK